MITFAKNCDMTLHLILKTCWYNMITQVIKREEYRENKPCWKKRLFSHKYTHVCFHRAYTNETMTYKIESISIGRGRAEWGAYEMTSNPPNRTIWFVDAQLWFADAAFCISKHPTTVNNHLHFHTFLPKSLHNPNKCFTFAATVPATPLP